jgi:hypothetical protein
MSTNLQRDPDSIFWASSASFQTSPPRPLNNTGDIQTAANDLDADHLIDAARAIQESIEEAFGKI